MHLKTPFNNIVQTLQYKSKQFFFVLIKISIVVIAFYFIYKKLTNNSNLSFSVFSNLSTENGVFSLKNMVLLLILSIFNWFFEILKWQTLVSSIKKISFISAFEQCLGSLTVSLFTPNRIGEYGAKAMYFTRNYRKRIVFINVLSNALQMLVTVVLGSIGLFFLIQTYPININLIKIVGILITSLIIICFIGFILKKINFTIKGLSLEKLKHFTLNFSKKRMAVCFIYSFLRYAIFSFQFYYLLLIFHVDISYFNAMIMISSMYFLSSIIPSIFLFDVFVKGSVAMYLFGFLDVNELSIISIVTLMWLLNFVLPSILGSYFVLQFRFPKVNLT